jgi:hypothetical protein
MEIVRLFAAVLTLAVAARAQTSRGTVTGSVLDPSGAVIRGAQVTLTGVDTGVRLTTDSNEAGVYRLDAVDSFYCRRMKGLILSGCMSYLATCAPQTSHPLHIPNKTKPAASDISESENQ